MKKFICAIMIACSSFVLAVPGIAPGRSIVGISAARIVKSTDGKEFVLLVSSITFCNSEEQAKAVGKAKSRELKKRGWHCVEQYIEYDANNAAHQVLVDVLNEKALSSPYVSFNDKLGLETRVVCNGSLKFQERFLHEVAKALKKLNGITDVKVIEPVNAD